jgi:GAF domain-containing protein
MDDANGMIRMVAAYGLRSSEFLPLPLGQGLAGNVAQSGKAMALEDAPADSRCIFPREARESGIASYMAAPLAADGQTLGVIEAHTSNRRTWTESEQRALESAAAIITELIKTTDMSGDRLRVETAYLGLSEALQRLRSADEVKEAVVEVLGHALGASRVIVVEFDEQGKPQPVTQEYRQPSAKSALGAVFTDDLSSRLTGQADDGHPLAISDSKNDSLMGAETAEALGVRSELVLPIRVEGKTRAVIYVHQCDRDRDWDKEEIDFADRVVRQLSLSLSNLRSLEAAFNDAKAARSDAQLAQTIAASLPEIVIGVDSGGKLTYFNSAAAKASGLAESDLGRVIRETSASAMLEQQVWETALACDSVVRLDSRLNEGSQGEHVAASVAVAPLRNGEDKINGRVIVVTELGHLKATNVSARISELEKKLESYERVLNQSRAAEEEARGMLARASALEAKARAESEVTRRSEAEAKKQLELATDSQKQAQGSAQQLLEINRLKSEFIVNAGHEIEASLQSVLGLAELLEAGSYGSLNPEQREAVHGIYGWARRIKSDVDWLVEYGSTRSRRLETSGAS